MEKLIPYIVGSGLTVIGFIARYLFDYFYLKSPHIKPKVIISSRGNNPPINGYRTYIYLIELYINNLSENIAYDFKLMDFVIDPAFRISLPFTQILIPQNPITSQVPFKIEISYSANLKVTPALATDSGVGQLKLLSKTYNLRFSYSNSLGKSYTKTYKQEMVLYQEKNIFNISEPI